MRTRNGPPALCPAIAVVMVFSAPAQAVADGWRCSNPDLEISCPAGKCEVADAHTSMRVTASASELSVCAYSGCWEGAPGAFIQSGRFQIYTGVRLPYMLDTDDGAHASLTVDRVAGVGTILISGMYAQPMICEEG